MNERVRDALDTKLCERAIDVIYRLQTERVSHWFAARPAELPETYPFEV